LVLELEKERLAVKPASLGFPSLSKNIVFESKEEIEADPENHV